jgi:hypothetical protein
MLLAPVSGSESDEVRVVVASLTTGFTVVVVGRVADTPSTDEPSTTWQINISPSAEWATMPSTEHSSPSVASGPPKNPAVVVVVGASVVEVVEVDVDVLVLEVVEEVEVLVVDDVVDVDVVLVDMVVDEVASTCPVAAPAVPVTSSTTAPLTIITAATARVRNPPPMSRLPVPAPGRA